MKNLMAMCVFMVACAVSTPTSEVGDAQQAVTCSGGQYDMLDWMTLDSNSSYHLDGSHPLYTTVWSDKFWWTKTSDGYTWDIMLYDNDYIYAWITESTWDDPSSFKKATYNTNFPMMPRCASAGSPGTYVLVSDTSYNAYSSCTAGSTQNVQKGIYELWGPYQISFGGDLPSNMDTLVLSWRWNCDNNYDNCATKEAYYLSQTYGLVRWESYSLHSGSYTLDQQTTFNQVVSGTVSPAWVCN